MAHPLRQHVQRDALHSGINAKPMAQTLRATMRGVGNARLDHHVLDDLPDSDAGERPDRYFSLPRRSLALTDVVCGVEGIEIMGRDGNGPVDDPGASFGVLALFETAERDCSAGKIDTGRRDLDQLGGAAPGMMQRLAESTVAGGPTAGDGQKSRAFLSVQVQPVTVIVMEAHLAHI